MIPQGRAAADERLDDPLACPAIPPLRTTSNDITPCRPHEIRQSFKLASGTSYLHRKMISSGAVPDQTVRVKLAMFKAYWRRLASVGRLSDRSSRWRFAS